MEDWNIKPLLKNKSFAKDLICQRKEVLAFFDFAGVQQRKNRIKGRRMLETYKCS